MRMETHLRHRNPSPPHLHGHDLGRCQVSFRSVRAAGMRRNRRALLLHLRVAHMLVPCLDLQR